MAHTSTPPAPITPTRIALGAVGVAGALWGAFLLLDDGFEALVSVAVWLAGGIVVHDFVLAPITLALTFVAGRFLPAPARMPVVVAFIVWATCSVASIAVLSGQGGKPGNDTILDRNYAAAWVVFTLVLATAAVVASVVRARRPAHDEPRAMFERPSWEERYGSGARTWSGDPNPQLVAEATDLAPGTALDVGCGEGADVLWLAGRGWQVTGLDFSQAGLDTAAAVAADAGLADRTRWERADIRTWQPTDSYDLISSQFVHLLDDGMVDVVARLAEALTPGGTLLVVGHHPDDVATGLRHAPVAGAMFTPADLAPALDPQRFDVTTEVRRRTQVKDGVEIAVQDSVVVARRQR